MLYVTKGLPASGKTYHAKEMAEENKSLRLVCKDDLRSMMLVGGWSSGKEKSIVLAEDAIIRELLIDGHDVCVHDTNFHPMHQKRFERIASETNTDIEWLDFTDVPLDVILKRNHVRHKKVPMVAILGMAKKNVPDKYEEFMDEWGNYLDHYISMLNRMFLQSPVSDKPPCVICDIDGTLALTSHRSPYEYHLSNNDDLNYAVYTVLENYPYDVIIVSGREDTNRPMLVNWLKDHYIKYDRLYMRQANDFRKDAIVKKEIYHLHIEPEFRVEFVIDDRDQVVAMWRTELYLPTLQANYGAF